MRKLVLLLFLGLLGACDFFTSKEELTKNRVYEELNAIDWNDVDQFPLFEGCDETATKQAQRECFQNSMLRIAADTLDSLSFEVENHLEDTLYVDFKVDEDGFISILEIEEKEAVLNEIADFNTLISEKLASLTVAPALKRGIPVSLRFRIPLVLNTEK